MVLFFVVKMTCTLIHFIFFFFQQQKVLVCVCMCVFVFILFSFWANIKLGHKKKSFEKRTTRWWWCLVVLIFVANWFKYSSCTFFYILKYCRLWFYLFSYILCFLFIFKKKRRRNENVTSYHRIQFFSFSSLSTTPKK